jgi:hypothetical protein
MYAVGAMGKQGNTTESARDSLSKVQRHLPVGSPPYSFLLRNEGC